VPGLEANRLEAPEKSLERQIRAFHWIRLLAELSGRSAGTDQEGEAGARVEVWLRDLGFEEIAAESVPSRPRPGWVWALHLGLGALGCALGGAPGIAWWNAEIGSAAGLALAALAALSFRREVSGGAPLLTRWLPVRDSLIVTARAGAQRPRRRVVLTAPLDAPQTTRLFAGRLGVFGAAPRDGIGAPRGLAAGPSALLAAAVVVTAAAALGARGIPVLAARVAVGAALAWLALRCLRWALAAVSPGANDAASGVAAMLTAAEQIAAHLPPDAELWCAATGGGQAGACGASALVQAHPEWFQGATAFLHFEGVGAGDLHYAASEGVLARTYHAPMLRELARRVAACGAYGFVAPAHLPTDTGARLAARRGGHVLSLVALGEDGLPLHHLSRDDRVNRVDTEAVIRAADFGACVVSAYLRGDAEPLAYV